MGTHHKISISATSFFGIKWDLYELIKMMPFLIPFPDI